MKKVLRAISPMPLAKLLAFLYGLVGAIACPALLIVSIRDSSGLPGVAFAVAVLVVYPLAGFLTGFMTAFMYNLAAKHIGGIEFEVEEPPNPRIEADAARPGEGEGRETE